MCEVCRPERPQRYRQFRAIDSYINDEDDPYEGYWGPSGGFHRAYSSRRKGCPIHGSNYTRPLHLTEEYDQPPPDTYGRYWRLSVPPKDHDVLIPSSMSGQYRLFFPSYSGSGVPLKWGYKDLGGGPKLPGREIASHTVPPERMHRVIGYQEPPYLVDFGQSPGPITGLPKPKPPVVTSPQRGGQPAQSGPGWKVFHCTDEQGSHTIVCIKDTVVEMRPQQTVQITQTTPESWFAKENHRAASCLGDRNANFSHCFLAYSNTIPQTHALIENFSLHVDDAVTIALTREAPPTAITQ